MCANASLPILKLSLLWAMAEEWGDADCATGTAVDVPLEVQLVLEMLVKSNGFRRGRIGECQASLSRLLEEGIEKLRLYTYATGLRAGHQKQKK